MEESKPTSRYKDSGCSFMVEVQPDYDREETEGTKGSSDDMTAGITDQQALVHREEIPDDRSSGIIVLAIHAIFSSLFLSLFQHLSFMLPFRRFRKHTIVRKHQYRPVAIGSFDIQSRFGQSKLPLRQSDRIRLWQSRLSHVRRQLRVRRTVEKAGGTIQMGGIR